MSAPAHWLEAEELPRCQHCPGLADERSFMCEDCAFQADTEVQELRDQLMKAVPLDTAVAALVDTLVDYDVPTGHIITKFRRLVADYAAEGGS